MDKGTIEHSEEEAFRDAISTVDKKGKRIWIYPKKPSGKYTRWRNWATFVLLSILFLGPFIHIGDEPLLMFNIIERKFVILGRVFWPQDFHLFVIAMILFVVFVILFTAAFGRLFCGWICPQTIFMEGLFRKIEYLIDGDFKAQKALAKGPLTTKKLGKRILKHAIFFSLSFIISNVFLAYIIGSEELFKIITEPVSMHIIGFISILLFAAVFYFVFSWMREQVCTTICPYGRLQGVLLDKHSIIVTYDYKRGENRAKFRKGEDRQAAGKGDCIDCNQCVNVCPTGIDIRNGTQLECTNCTACIDACNFMMEKTGLEKSLIRYDSEHGIQTGKKFVWTPRLKAYSVVLFVLMGAMISMLIYRSDIEATILRTRGMIYQERPDGTLTNLYNIKILNKTKDNYPLRLELIGSKGHIEIVGDDSLYVDSGETIESTLFVVIDPDDLKGLRNEINIGVYRGDEKLDVLETTFIKPSI